MKRYKNGCHVVEIHELQDFHNFVLNNYKPVREIFFRGQANASWLLESSLDRHVKGLNPKLASPDLSAAHLSNFKLMMRGRLHNPIPHDDKGWWALGRHFGLYAPLMDWTRSPYIAAFFACIENEPSEVNSAVYAIYPEQLQSLNKKLASLSADDQRKLLGTLDQVCEVQFVDPFENDNSRLISQNALFVQLPFLVDLELWIDKLAQDDIEVLYKLVIDSDTKADFLEMLDSANINFSTLFPDTMGASLYCNSRLDAYSDFTDVMDFMLLNGPKTEAP